LGRRALRAAGAQDLDKDPALRAESLGLVPEGLERSSAVRATVRGQLRARILGRIRRLLLGHRIWKGSLTGRINMGSRFAGVIIRCASERPVDHEAASTHRPTSRSFRLTGARRDYVSCHEK